MNLKFPFQLSSGRWVYAGKVGAAVVSIGYCSGWDGWSDEHKQLALGPDYQSIFSAYEDREKPFLSKYHSSGHDSLEDACICYKEYLLDHLVIEHSRSAVPEKCENCGEPVEKVIDIYGQLLVLCEKHNSREELSRRVYVRTLLNS